MDANDRYEIKARAFQAMTGAMAPGKSCPPQMSNSDPDLRQALWDQWEIHHGRTVNAMLEAFEWHLKRGVE